MEKTFLLHKGHFPHFMCFSLYTFQHTCVSTIQCQSSAKTWDLYFHGWEGRGLSGLSVTCLLKKKGRGPMRDPPIIFAPMNKPPSHSDQMHPLCTANLGCHKSSRWIQVGTHLIQDGSKMALVTKLALTKDKELSCDLQEQQIAL